MAEKLQQTKKRVRIIQPINTHLTENVNRSMQTPKFLDVTWVGITKPRDKL